MAAAASHLECPVCHEGFTEPKLLPCTHLVCCKCVLSWLEKGGDQNGCPLCRAPILPESAKAQGDLASQVDALPTDFATAAVVVSTKALNGSHTCGCCEDEGASLFCLQCGIKLCSACAKLHAKMPVARDHVTEKLDDLSAEQLALYHHVPCANHSTEQAKLYCTHHEELICVLCAASAHGKCCDVASPHRKCCDVEGIEAVATVKREELKAEVKKLEEKEAALTDKINKLDIEVSDAHAKFKAMKDDIRVTFDDLQRSLEAQREKLNSDVQQREDTFLAERKSFKLELENHKSDLSAHRSTAERLVTDAPNSSLLGMMGKLKARLDALMSQDRPKDPEVAVGSLIFNPGIVKIVKDTLATIGRLTDPSTTEQVSSRQMLGNLRLPFPHPQKFGSSTGEPAPAQPAAVPGMFVFRQPPEDNSAPPSASSASNLASFGAAPAQRNLNIGTGDVPRKIKNAVHSTARRW